MKLEERYNQFHKNFNESDEMIWQYIKKNRADCIGESINALADRCNVSRTTILRFSKKLGFEGYSEFKITLRQESQGGREHLSNINQVVGLYNDVIRQIHQRDCRDVFRLIDNARGLYVYSSGMAQSTVGREMTRVFMNAERLFFEIKGKAEISHILETISPKDVVFMISYSGASEETVGFARALKIRGVPMVSMTTRQENELAKLSDINLYSSSLTLEKGVPDISYTSLTTFYILVEMLFLKYREYREAGGERES